MGEPAKRRAGTVSPQRRLLCWGGWSGRKGEGTRGKRGPGKGGESVKMKLLISCTCGLSHLSHNKRAFILSLHCHTHPFENRASRQGARECLGKWGVWGGLDPLCGRRRHTFSESGNGESYTRTQPSRTVLVG